MIKTVDTDVLVLAIALFPKLNLKELWIDFRTGQNKFYYPVHIICQNLGQDQAEGLLFFHAFTGCDLPGVIFCSMQEKKCMDHLEKLRRSNQRFQDIE